MVETAVIPRLGKCGNAKYICSRGDCTSGAYPLTQLTFTQRQTALLEPVPAVCARSKTSIRARSTENAAQQLKTRNAAKDGALAVVRVAIHAVPAKASAALDMFIRKLYCLAADCSVWAICSAPSTIRVIQQIVFVALRKTKRSAMQHGGFLRLRENVIPRRHSVALCMATARLPLLHLHQTPET